MNLEPGVCFQVAGKGFHLKVVVTFPDKDGKVLAFGLTDAEHVEEDVCVFAAGDHPFFTKPTAVSYRRSLVLPAKGFHAAMLTFHRRFRADQIARIVESAHTSEDIEPRILKMLPAPGRDFDAFLEGVAKLPI